MVGTYDDVDDALMVTSMVMKSTMIELGDEYSGVFSGESNDDSSRKSEHLFQVGHSRQAQAQNCKKTTTNKN